MPKVEHFVAVPDEQISVFIRMAALFCAMKVSPENADAEFVVYKATVFEDYLTGDRETPDVG